MREVLTPKDEADAAAMIKAARSEKRALMIEGGGTRAGLGRPVKAGSVLSTRALTGITLYEPAELVISARAGTRLAEIEAALEKNKQRLPFEPMDHRALFATEGEPTIGAIAACNVSGPRRIQLGAARDHLIGVRLVNGFGEIIKSGGRVKKNVTGLDLVKLSCSAYGTLGLLTEVTFKLLPEPEVEATLVLRGLDDRKAIVALSAGLTSPYQITGAAHLPADVAKDGKTLTLLRIDGPSVSVDYRAAVLAQHLGPFGTLELLAQDEAKALWLAIRDALPIVEPQESAVWRLSVAPSRGPDVVAAIQKRLAARYFYDWGGGLIWLAVAPEKDAGAAKIREALAEAAGPEGGHATLIRAPEEIRATVDVFQPLAKPLMEITQGIKASFDPNHILNPGRMYARI
jgi:glycolate oxidase FAD binding subunit